MINIISKIINKKIYLINIDYLFVIKLLKIIEKLKINFFIKSEQVLRLNEDKIFSNKKAYNYFGYKPQDFYNTISREIKIYKDTKYF